MTTKRLLSLLLLLLPLSLGAQTTDTFDSDSANWSTTDTDAYASLVVADGVLNLNFDAVVLSASGDIYRTWTSAQSSGSDWSVYFDFDFNDYPLLADQDLTWFLNAASASNLDNYVSVGALDSSILSNPVAGASWHDSSNNSGSFGTTPSFTGTTGTIGLAFDSDQKLLIAGYDEDGAAGGYSFTSIGSYDITGWGLGDSGSIYASIGLSYNVGTTTLPAIGNGFVTADNFTVTNFNVSAVPEPSTYAALFGLTALGAAFWRRRRRTIA